MNAWLQRQTGSNPSVVGNLEVACGTDLSSRVDLKPLIAVDNNVSSEFLDCVLAATSLKRAECAVSNLILSKIGGSASALDVRAVARVAQCGGGGGVGR